MVDDHLGGSALEGLIAGWLSPESERQRLLHVLFCSACRQALLENYPRRGLALLREAFGEVPDWVEQGSLLDRDANLRREVQAAPLLIEELASCPTVRQGLLVRNLKRFQTVPLAAACLAESKIYWHRDPDLGKAWVDLAWTVLDCLPADRYSPVLVASFRARACAYRGNIYRNASDLQAAGEAFSQAWTWYEKGGRSATEWAELAAFESSYYRDCRDFQQAYALLDRAIAIYEQEENWKEAAKLKIAKALALTEEGWLSESIALLEAVMNEFDLESLGKALYSAVLHNLTNSLARAGNTEKARVYLPEVRQLAEASSDRFHPTRVDWLEALILQAEGNWFQSIALFRRVQNEFVEADMAYDAALVSLDLAALHLDIGQTAEARDLATAMLPIFRSRQIHREAATAGLLLVEALKREAAEVEVVRELSTYMRQTRRGVDK